jgi:proteic killer suppression protein
VIKQFADAATEAVFRGESPKGFPAQILRAAERKLMLLNYAKMLTDLRLPPGNRLHALTGDRKGQHAISINDQYRLCFVWREDGVYQVEITDYH